MESKKQYRIMTYAMSMSASWAWGTSLVVGMQIAQTRGVVPYIIWAVANSLALPLFGFLAFRIKGLDRVINSKPVMVFTTAVQCFCLWIQMNAVYEILTKYNIADELVAKLVSIIIAVIFLFALYNNGLIRAVLTDQPIWSLCYIGLVIIVIAGFAANGGIGTYTVLTDKSDIGWALYTSLVLFSGPFMDIQNWMLARKVYSEGKLKSYYLAGVLFAAYMIFVCVLSCLKFNRIMEMILAVVIICVATSTINNAIVGIQKIAGKKVGFVIAAVCIAGWQIVIPLGVMGLWLTIGTARIYVVGICFMICFIKYIQNVVKNKKAVIR